MSNDFSPREIVSELDKHIVGQQEAKRAVAIALRNRWRRLQLSDALRDEVLPKNILMIGPTGVGKTEIARRLAKLTNAPFLKVEATKFTEVGYVGRDVESIVRDLLEIGIALVRERKRRDVEARAHLAAEERVLESLVGPGAGAAAALVPLVRETGGSVVVLGTPAEEGGGGKILMARQGAFADVDAALIIDLVVAYAWHQLNDRYRD